MGDKIRHIGWKSHAVYKIVRVCRVMDKVRRYRPVYTGIVPQDMHAYQKVKVARRSVFLFTVAHIFFFVCNPLLKAL